MNQTPFMLVRMSRLPLFCYHYVQKLELKTIDVFCMMSNEKISLSDTLWGDKPV